MPTSLSPSCAAGLGYYRRARYLLDGAKYVVSELGGQLPGTAAELQKIPGAWGGPGGVGGRCEVLLPTRPAAPGMPLSCLPGLHG